MTRRHVFVTSIVVVGLVAVAAAVYFLLIGPRGIRYALPDCNELPSVAEVEDAIRDHDASLETIRDIDPAIEITATRPCADDPDRGAVLITVPDRRAADRVSEAMGTMPALGVPSTIEVKYRR